MLANAVQGYLDQNGTPEHVEKIVKYCIKKENGKVFDGWGENIITTMVTYHISKKTISVIYDTKIDLSLKYLNKFLKI